MRQSTQRFIDRYEQRSDPRGRPYYWNSSVFSLGEIEDDTDVAALRRRDGSKVLWNLREHHAMP